MKKFFALLLVMGVVTIGCQGTESTTPEVTPDATAPVEGTETDETMDEHADHDHAEGDVVEETEEVVE
jgi:hypothetical protein